LEIKSQVEQDDWFDSGRGCGIRIRESFGIDGGMVTTLGTKRVSNEHGHKALSEAEVVVESCARAALLLQMMDRREFLTIDKTRKTFELGEFEIAVDSILNYGVGVEIEYKGALGIDEAFAKIKELAGKLGLGDGDQFEKSLTVDAMQVLAKY
jgi:predicted adenylyl cyclase CyaB